MHEAFRLSRSLAFVSATVLTLGLTACGKEVSRTGGTLSQLNPPAVCVPSDPNNPGNEDNGLAGKIYYLENDQPRATGVNDLITRGKDAGVTLILNHVSVPTGKFTQGFLDPVSGVALKGPNGNVLIEWFGFDVKSDLALQSTEADGYYQVAVIADDGAVLDLEAVGSTPVKTLVNNDGIHSTKMACSSKAILMKKSQPRPIRLRYLQGPRDHIALTLMWRKVSTETAALDALCGTEGQTAFWNPATTPSTPSAKYKELVARGWKVPGAGNFVLPPEIPTNPCSTSL